MKKLIFLFLILFSIQVTASIITNNIKMQFSPDGMMATYYLLYDDVSSNNFNSGITIYDKNGNVYLYNEQINGIKSYQMICFKKKIIIISTQEGCSVNDKLYVAYRVTKKGLKKLNEKLVAYANIEEAGSNYLGVKQYDGVHFGLEEYDLKLKKLLNKVPLVSDAVSLICKGKFAAVYNAEVNSYIVRLFKKGKEFTTHSIYNYSSLVTWTIIDKKGGLLYWYEYMPYGCNTNTAVTYVNRKGKKIFELKYFDGIPLRWNVLAWNCKNYLYVSNCETNEIIVYKIGKEVKKVNSLIYDSNKTCRVSLNGNKVIVIYTDNKFPKTHFVIYDRSLKKTFYTSKEYDSIIVLDDCVMVCMNYIYDGVGNIIGANVYTIKNGKEIGKQYINMNF